MDRPLTPTSSRSTAERLRQSRRIWTDALANPRGDHTLDATPLDPSARAETRRRAGAGGDAERADASVHRAVVETAPAFRPDRLSGRAGRSQDASIAAAAYREADGGDRPRAAAHSRFSVISIPTVPTNYLVMPVVGDTPDYTLTLNPHEVAHAFEVPLRFLMNPRHHELHSREWKGRMRRYYAIPYEEHYIWGVTAGIVRNLYERLYSIMTRAIIQERCCFSCLSPPTPSSWSSPGAIRWHGLPGASTPPGSSSRAWGSSSCRCWRAASSPPRQAGTYVPSHMENGVLVPGHFE